MSKEIIKWGEGYLVLLPRSYKYPKGLRRWYKSLDTAEKAVANQC